MKDTLDLIPIGAYFGKGNRKGLFGSFLMAAFCAREAQFYTICKLGTGFSMSDCQELTETLKKDQVEKQLDCYSVSKSVKPDVWLAPKYVWEVGADCFT